MKSTIFALSACLALTTPAWADQPDYYPSDYGKMVEAAKAEGRVVLYITLDPYAVTPFVSEFEAMYPGIKVEVNSMSSAPMHSRFISEEAAKGATADIMISSGMDLQVQLVNDGHALAYESAELSHIPKWASWNNQAYSVTIDPVIFVYNKGFLTPEQVPQSYAQIPEVLAKNADTYRGRIALGDVDRGGVPLLFGIMGSVTDPNYWDIFGAVGKLKPNFIPGSSAVIESVSSGENILSLNQMGAYVLPVIEKNPDVAMVLPSDYTLGNSRVMFIAKSTPHPNASKLFVDFMLSKRGQTVLMNGSKMYPIREDIEGPYTAKSLMATLGTAFRPIPLSPELLANLDPKRRTEFIERWKRTLTGKN